MSKVIRFPTEKCRLPGETEFNHAWRMAKPYMLCKRPSGRCIECEKWELPLLDELANGVQDSYPYP